MTMEDVWKEISLASLCDHNSPAAAGTRNGPAAVRGFVFQDFMASAASTKLAPSSLATDLAPPPPATLLCLSSSGPDHFQQYQLQSTTATAITSTNTSAPPIREKLNRQRLQGASSTRPSSSSVISFSNNGPLDSSPYCKKRAVEEKGENSRHVRNKRMIKNRESASRSRARKQAYTSELELELAHLKEENANIKRWLEKGFVHEGLQSRLAAPVVAATTPKRARSV